MAGAIVLVVVLLIFPLLVGIGGSVLAMILGGALKANGVATHPESEYLELNR